MRGLPGARESVGTGRGAPVCSRGVKLSAPSSAVRGRRPERAVVRRSWSFLICDSSASACSRSSRSCTSLAARLRSSAAAACESGVRGVAGMLPCVLFRCTHLNTHLSLAARLALGPLFHLPQPSCLFLSFLVTCVSSESRRFGSDQWQGYANNKLLRKSKSNM